MSLIDRYILRRFLANFAILLALLFCFASSIDLIVNLDEFVQVARRRVGDEATTLSRLATLVGLMANFQGPRVFLFYAHMHGFVAIGAMGFTLAQMHRHRELVALLASGVSLQRLAMPFLGGVLVLSLGQLLNQELLLNRVAPLLLRGHGDIGERGIDQFPVRFTRDGAGNLLQSPSFNPADETLKHATFLERDERGRTVCRVTASLARWDEGNRGWQLAGGQAMRLPETATGSAAAPVTEPVAFVATDLSPRMLTMRRYGQYASMLSLRQIGQMLQSPGTIEMSALLRYKYARFSAILLNCLVLALALPSFLLREPAGLMRQSVTCAAIALPAMMGGVVSMMIDLPGIPPALSVFLPALVLIPLVLARWTFLKT